MTPTFNEKSTPVPLGYDVYVLRRHFKKIISFHFVPKARNNI